MKRMYEYQMLDPLDTDELPDGVVEHEVYKDSRGVFGWWGRLIIDHPLDGNEIGRYNLDGPLAVWR